MAVNPKDVSNVHNRMAISRAMAQAKQPFRPGPVIASDWPLDRRRVQAEQAIGLPRPDQAPSAFISQRPLEGAQPNNRGHAVRLVFGDGSTSAQNGRPQTPVVICESPKASGEDAEEMSVVCSLLVLSSSGYVIPAVTTVDPLTAGFNVKGFIEWGIGGASFDAEFDWNQGQILKVPASYIRIRASYLGFLPGSPDALPPDIVLGTAFAYHSSARRNPAQLTTDVFTLIHNGVKSSIPVPAYATSFSIVYTGTGSPNLQVRIESGPEFIGTFVMSSDANDARQVEQFPLPGGATAIEVTNLDGSNTATFRILFQLAL